jgi:hypothetical protein
MFKTLLKKLFHIYMAVFIFLSNGTVIFNIQTDCEWNLNVIEQLSFPWTNLWHLRKLSLGQSRDRTYDTWFVKKTS